MENTEKFDEKKSRCIVFERVHIFNHVIGS